MVFKSLIKKILNKKEKNLIFVPEFTDDKYIKIYLLQDYQRIKIQEDFDSNVFLLTNLTNLNLSEDNYYFYISYDNVYELYYNDGQEVQDYKLLNLPEIYKGYMYIENYGNYIVDKEVKYSFGFKNGVNLDIRRKKNNILDVDGKYYLLPEKMFKIVKLLEKYNTDSDQNSQTYEQFAILKVIKDYSEETNIILNKKLSDEEKPIIIDKIKIDFKEKDDFLEVFPVIEGQNAEFNKEFLNKFDKDNRIRNFYNVKQKDKNIKVIFRNKESAEKLKRNRILKGDKKSKFIKGDNEIFQDENFDLTLYGPRVKGIGYLNYRANEGPRNNLDGSWFELPLLYTNEEPLILEPKDKKILEDGLIKLNTSNSEYTEIEIIKENKPIKLIMNKEEILSEINKIENSIKTIQSIKNEKELEELKKLSVNNKDEYISFKGNYIVNEGTTAIEKQISKVLAEKNERRKKETLLAKENLEEEEYSESRNTPINRVVDIPKSLRVDLYEHQKEGLKKFQNLYLASSLNGFLLADDMGLGKTLQILAFLAWLKEKNDLQKALIVVPGTLLKNWDNSYEGTGEIQKFFNNELFKTHHIRGVIKKEEENEQKEKIEKSDLIFITYQSLRLNNIFLGTFKWNIMICDEIQKAKNPKTLLSVALKTQNANFKIACSATPIENSLEDLWNIVDFALPGIFGSMKSFKNKYGKSQESDNLKEKEIVNNELVATLGDNYLRRSKNEYLQGLPKKKVVINFLKANDTELKYIKHINALKKEGVSSLPLIQKLVALCSHVDLISGINNKDPEKLIAKSSKLKKLKEILDNIKSKNEKVIIFTIFIKMQHIIARVIKYWYDIDCRIINGKIELNKRAKFLDEFKNKKGFNVIILSPEVAGVGINLIEANHVIHYTRLWNPAKEVQATDRVYRIGQKKDVYVYYPILTFKENREMNFESEESYVNFFLNKKYNLSTPEERLNKIIVKKKNILNKFFLAATNEDIDVVKEWDMDNEEYKEQNLAEILEKSLDFEEFKSLVSLMYKMSEYDTFLITDTPNNSINILIKPKDEAEYKAVVCNFNQAIIFNDDFLQHLRGNKKILSIELNIIINKLLIVSNNIIRCTQNIPDIEIIDKDILSSLINKKQIKYDDIVKENGNRYSIERLKNIIN